MFRVIYVVLRAGMRMLKVEIFVPDGMWRLVHREVQQVSEGYANQGEIAGPWE